VPLSAVPSTQRALEPVAAFDALYAGNRNVIVTAGCPGGWAGTQRGISIRSADETCTQTAKLDDCSGAACAVDPADFDTFCAGQGARSRSRCAASRRRARRIASR